MGQPPPSSIFSDSLDQYHVVVCALETMLAHFAIGGTVVPSFRFRGTRELENYRTFGRGPFEVFVLAVKRENLGVVPS